MSRALLDPTGGALAFVPAAPPPDDDAEPPRLDASWNGLRMTPAEFDAVTDSDETFRYELVNGVVVVSPAPGDGHEAQIDALAGLLWVYKHQHSSGAALDDTLPGRYVATSRRRRRADRVLWCGLGRRPDTTADVPAVVVEVVSRRPRARRRDDDLKRAEYREAGVLEYWLADARDRTVTACFADGSETVVRAGGVLTTPLLPGFELPVDVLLSAADRREPPADAAGQPGADADRDDE